MEFKIKYNDLYSNISFNSNTLIGHIQEELLYKYNRA